MIETESRFHKVGDIMGVSFLLGSVDTLRKYDRK